MKALLVIVIVVALGALAALWVSARRRVTAEQVDAAGDRQLLDAEMSVLADDVINLESRVAGNPAARADYDAAVSRFRVARAALDAADEPGELARAEQLVHDASFSMSRARAQVEGRPPPTAPPVAAAPPVPAQTGPGGPGQWRPRRGMGRRGMGRRSGRRRF